MDSDLRKPGVRRALNLTGGKEAGLSSYLAGVSSLDEVMTPHPSISNLTALTTGPIPPSPADLLSSHRMREGITELRRRFKFIVIDSPPVMAATDAVILSALTDGVLLVVRSGETPKEAFTRTRDLLSAVRCRLLGVVLNAVDSNAPDYYYSIVTIRMRTAMGTAKRPASIRSFRPVWTTKSKLKSGRKQCAT